MSAEGGPLQDFLDHLAKERDVSPNTVKAYARDLDAFIAFLSNYYGTREWTWGGVDRLAIRGFMAHLTKRGLGKRSIARALSAVRSFYRFLHLIAHLPHGSQPREYRRSQSNGLLEKQ